MRRQCLYKAVRSKTDPLKLDWSWTITEDGKEIAKSTKPLSAGNECRSDAISSPEHKGADPVGDLYWAFKYLVSDREEYGEISSINPLTISQYDIEEILRLVELRENIVIVKDGRSVFGDYELPRNLRALELTFSGINGSRHPLTGYSYFSTEK